MRTPEVKVRREPDLLAIHDFTTLVAANARSSRQRDRVLRAAGVPLTAAGLSVLRIVERHGPIAVSEVARRLSVDQSTVSRQIRPVEELGLVAREIDDADRRVAWLTLTDEGTTLLRRVDDVALHDFDVALADWSPADRARLAQLLARFREDLLANQLDESGWSVRPDA
jgi:DNA-binding MarR family transcriptional regulator